MTLISFWFQKTKLHFKSLAESIFICIYVHPQNLLICSWKKNLRRLLLFLRSPLFSSWLISLDFVNRVSSCHFDLKIKIVLTLRSRQIMKRDLYHWILHKILKKKCFISFFGQFTFLISCEILKSGVDLTLLAPQKMITSSKF